MKSSGSQKLLNLAPFPTEKYEQLSLATLTTYSAYWLVQWGVPTTLENVAVLNFKLFPTKFAMVGWAEFPDVNRTNRSVLQMRPKYRNFATSITDKGIFLNERGIAEAESLLARLGPPIFHDGSTPVLEMPIPRVRGSGRPTTVHAEDLISQVRKSRLFQTYKAGEWAQAEPIDLINFLGVYDHTPSEEKRRRIRSLEMAADEVNDTEVKEFLLAVLSTFSRYLHK